MTNTSPADRNAPRSPRTPACPAQTQPPNRASRSQASTSGSRNACGGSCVARSSGRSTRSTAAESSVKRGMLGRLRAMADTLSITDNRTGKTYEVEITDDTIKAMDLRQIKVAEDDFGMMAYDPAFTNTASCRSEITYIDGAAGVLEYRGYPIEQLCEQSSYLEVAYLLINGELPNKVELDRWVHEITIHTFVHENVKDFMQGFRYDAHPMGMLLAATGALSTFYPEASNIKDEPTRDMQIIRLLAKV